MSQVRILSPRPFHNCTRRAPLNNGLDSCDAAALATSPTVLGALAGVSRNAVASNELPGERSPVALTRSFRQIAKPKPKTMSSQVSKSTFHPSESGWLRGIVHLHVTRLKRPSTIGGYAAQSL